MPRHDTLETRVKVNPFCTGRIVATAAIATSELNVFPYLDRHIHNDWGDGLTDFDWNENDKALSKEKPLRLVSWYDTGVGRIMIITEWDRSYTTILFPQEY